MANFKPAFEQTITHEGGYVNDPKDRGGETYRGIARNYHPNWNGWVIIDSLKPIKRGALLPQLSPSVESFYRDKFWRKVQGDLIASQAVADLLFDWAVNSGAAIKQVQQVLNNQFGANLVADGIAGKKTVSALNIASTKNEAALINGIVNARIAYYAKGVANGWLDNKFLGGLVKRAGAYSMPVKYRAV